MELRVKEFLEGKDTLTLGPKVLELSITTACDSSCLGCWCHSPLVKDFLPQEEKEKFLPYPEVKRLLEELVGKGLEEIQLSGSGEPLLHPHLWEIVEIIKEKNLRCHLVTNFLSIRKEEVVSLIEKGVDTLTVSIWAGTPETYVLLHPNRKEEDFVEISQKIRFLVEERERRGKIFPRVKIYHVLNHLNAEEVETMLDHALEVGADMLEFKSVDVIRGKTDLLAFTPEDVEKIREGLKRIKERVDFPYSVSYNPFEVPHLQILSDYQLRRELADFGRFLKTSFLPPQFRITYEKRDPYNPEPRQLNILCPMGKINHRSLLKEEPEQTFYFFYFREYCKECKKVEECFKEEEVKEIKLPFLSLMAIGRMERELENYLSCGRYAQGIVDKIPCYAGWLYARIEADGEVIPCCRGHRFPVGNIFKEEFFSIWNGEREREFRRRGRERKKEAPLFQLIGCREGCDNLGMNIGFHIEVEKG